MSHLAANPQAKCQPQPLAENSSSGSSASLDRTQPNTHILTLQRAVGNRAVGNLLRSPTNLPLFVKLAPALIQTKLTVAQPSNPLEQEADHVAEQVIQTPVSQANQISKQPKAIGIQRLRTAEKSSASDAQVDSTTASSIRAVSGGGQPLSQSVRNFFEPRLGQDFSNVRVHTNTQAAESAQAIQARAYTLQQNIVFAPGEYAPDSVSGRKLLAHELTHVVQQGKESHNTVYRQPQTESSDRYPLTSSLPPLSLPYTGLTLFPGTLTPGLLGSQIPLPASLRLTNALSVGTGPTFVLDLSPKLLVGTILGNVNLQTGVASGTPSSAAPTPENQANLSLINPIISFNPSQGKLRGTAVLSVPTQYPSTLVPPTTVEVEIESTELGAFNGKLGYGPLAADFTLTLKYDTARLERALSPAFAPTGGLTGFWVRLQSILRNTIPGIRLNSLSDALQSLIRDVQIKTINVSEFVSRTINLIQSSIPPNADLASLRTALSELGTEITNPGFNLSGNLRLGALPISNVSSG